MAKRNELPEGFPDAEETVLRVGRFFRAIDYEIDQIPPSWDLHLTLISHNVEKIDYEAQRVLAFILAWHSPGPRDQPRFALPALDIRWKLLMQRFRMTENAVQRVLKRMEDHGVIVRHSGGLGEDRGAFLHIAPVMDRVEAITYPVQMDTGTGKLVRRSTGAPVSGGPYYKLHMPSHEIAPTGFVSREDDDLVHVFSLQTRTALHHDTVLSSNAPIGHLSVGEGGELVKHTIETNKPTGPSVFENGKESVKVTIETNGESGDIGLATSGTPVVSGATHDSSKPTNRSSVSGLSLVSDAPHASESSSQQPADRTQQLETGGEHGPPAANDLASVSLAERLRDQAALKRQLDLFRQQYEYELWSARDDANAQRAVIRRALRDATGLLQGDDGTAKLADWVRNAWSRLNSAGASDPAAILLGVAVFACGRVTGTTEARAALAHALLDGVSRPFVLQGLVAPPNDAEVQVALRRAFLYRLDADNLKRLARRVCNLSDKPQTFAFVRALARLYATHDVPFNASLFASALAASVRDHCVPSASDLLDACEQEAARYPWLRVLPGDHVLIQEYEEGYTGSRHEAVLRLGSGRRERNAHGQEWAKVVRVANEQGECDDGSLVDTETAFVDRTRYSQVQWLAERTR